MFDDVKKCYGRMNELIDLSLNGFGTEKQALKMLYKEGFEEDVIAEAIGLAQVVEELRKTGRYTMSTYDALYSDEYVVFICEQFEEGSCFKDNDDNDEVTFFTSCDDYDECYYEWLFDKAYELYQDKIEGLWLDLSVVRKFWDIHHIIKAVNASDFDFLSASPKEQYIYLAYAYVIGRISILPDEAVDYVYDIYEYLYDDDIAEEILLFKFNIFDEGKDVDECIDRFIDGCIEDYVCYGSFY